MRPIYVTETPATFRLSFEYNPRLIEIIRRVPSIPKWDGTEKEWVIKKNSNNYPPGRDARWYVEAFAQWAVQQRYCTNISRRNESHDTIYEIPAMKEFSGEHYMMLTPYPYQLEGVRYALDHQRCIFGDQPGLGKTLQAICSVVKAHKEAQRYGDSFPTLVICPAALKVNWQREFKKFAGLSSVILDDRNRDSWHRFYELKRSDGEPLSPVFSRLARSKLTVKEADSEQSDTKTDASQIRVEFDGQMAALMAHFKFQIDATTMKATVYAHLVGRYNREIKAKMAAMKKV